MRRGIGVAHVRTKNNNAKAMADAGAQLDALRTGRIADNIQLLEERLKELAKKHEALIRKDPVVRSKFKTLADSLGIDMLDSNANVFAKTLGFGNYYHELSVHIIDICMQEKARMASTSSGFGAGGGGHGGGLVPMSVILRRLHKWRPSDNITEQDVCFALDKVRVLGSGYDVVKLAGDSSRTYVRATPEEMNTDVFALMRFVSSKKVSGGASGSSIVAGVGGGNQGSSPSSSTPSSTAPLTSIGSAALGPKRIGVGVGAARGNPTATRAQTPSPPPPPKATLAAEDADIPQGFENVTTTKAELMSPPLSWSAERVDACLKAAMKEGMAWVDIVLVDGPSAEAGPPTGEAEAGKKKVLKKGSASPQQTGKNYWARKEKKEVYWLMFLLLENQGASL